MENKERTAVDIIARVGFIGKGAVYFMVGLLALQATIGMGSQQSGTTQALQEFLYQPFGSVLLIGCIIGLLAHALWRMIQALGDPENRGKSYKNIFFRVIDFIVGCLYLSFSYAAWQIFQGLNAQSTSESTEIWVARILDLPFGKWLVLIVALAVLAIAFYQFYTAYKANFEYSFDTQSMSNNEQQMLRQLGRIGFSAWGIVYLMIAVMLYQAAITYNAKQAGGLSDALNALRQQPYGLWILGTTAVGLLIYGIYLLVLAYYHRL
ncbi:MAG TPA: DUF1206 domain-containing protein [Fodinibius sp.]|nr:DUF1206 domain-containing protein [Fodinibius sp.]